MSFADAGGSHTLAQFEDDQDWQRQAERGFRLSNNADEWVLCRELARPREIWGATMMHPRPRHGDWGAISRTFTHPDRHVPPAPDYATRAVISALESSQYLWRTVRGVAQEQNLDPDTVAEIIAAHGDVVVMSTRRSRDGQTLFTTRAHYRRQASVWEKLLGALKMRIN